MKYLVSLYRYILSSSPLVEYHSTSVLRENNFSGPAYLAPSSSYAVHRYGSIGLPLETSLTVLLAVMFLFSAYLANDSL